MARWSYGAASAPATLTATVYATDGQTAFASGEVKVGYYDKTTGGAATSSTPEDKKVLFGCRTFAANRAQPYLFIKNASSKMSGYYGTAPKEWYSITHSLVGTSWWSDPPGRYLNFATLELRGDKTGLYHYEASFAAETPFLTVKNTGADCALKVQEQFKAMSFAAPCMSTTSKWGMTLSNTSQGKETSIWSGDMNYNSDSYTPFETTFSLEIGMKTGDSATVANKMSSRSLLRSFLGSGYAESRFGSDGMCVKYPYTQWRYPVLFSVAPVPVNDMRGTGQADILVSRKTAGAPGAREAAGPNLSVVSIDAKGKVTADTTIQNLSVEDAWSLLGVANFDEAYLPGLLFYDSAQRAFFQVPLTFGPDGATAGDAKNIVALQLAEGQEFAGEGDFNGEGHSDLLIRDTTTGALSIYYITFGALAQDPAVVGTCTVSSAQDVKIGDFDGNGVDDLVLRDATTGDCVMILLEADGSMRSETVVSAMESAYRIWGTGDFDGDGKDDLLWVETATGAPTIFLMDGAAVLNLGEPKLPGKPWKNGGSPAGIGDYNGDGRSDILWTRKDKKGLVLSVSFMDGLTVCKSKIGKSGPLKLQLGLDDQVIE